jgi:hypothetical protein
VGAINVLRTPALYTPGTLINLTPVLRDRLARPALLINPDDAAALLVSEGEATVVMGGAEVAATVKLDEDAPVGLALLRGAGGNGAAQTAVVRSTVAELA